MRPSVLVTGGTGYIGSAIVSQLLNGNPSTAVRVLSRDGTKQASLAAKYGLGLELMLGDVRDLERMREAVCGVDLVIHAAALKHVPACEENPEEAVLTNAVGTSNVLRACVEANVEKLIVVSTDKACEPYGVMGATKMIAERMIAALNKKGASTRACCVRLGNVLGSQGSVLPIWEKQINAGQALMVTDPEMTRFIMSPAEAVEFILSRKNEMLSGAIFVKKMSAVRLADLVDSVIRVLGTHIKPVVVGVRAGEKKHESLLSSAELSRAYDLGEMFVILPDSQALALPRAEPHCSLDASHLTGPELDGLVRDCLGLPIKDSVAEHVTC